MNKMAKNKIKNLDSLVNQYWRENFKEIVIKLDEDRYDESFESFIEHGGLGSINLYNKGYNDEQGLDALDDWLAGKKVDIYANGTKIMRTTISDRTKLRFGGSSNSIYIEDEAGSFRLEEVFPNAAANLPEEVKSLENFATAFNVKTITLKAVDEAKGSKAPSTGIKTTGESSGSGESVDSKGTNPKIIIGAAVVAVAASVILWY